MRTLAILLVLSLFPVWAKASLPFWLDSPQRMNQNDPKREGWREPQTFSNPQPTSTRTPWAGTATQTPWAGTATQTPWVGTSTHTPWMGSATQTPWVGTSTRTPTPWPGTATRSPTPAATVPPTGDPYACECSAATGQVLETHPLAGACGITVDWTDNIYVSSNADGNVYAFYPDWTPHPATTPMAGKTSYPMLSYLTSPTFLTGVTYSARISVCRGNIATYYIQYWNNTATLLMPSVAQNGQGPSTHGLTYFSSCSQALNRVYVWDGFVTTTLTGNGMSGDFFSAPVSTAFDGGVGGVNQNLWIADQGNNRLVKLDKDLLFIRSLPSDHPVAIVCGAGDDLFVACQTAVKRYDKDGTFKGNVVCLPNAPSQMAFDRTGNLWIADNINGLVLKVQP